MTAKDTDKLDAVKQLRKLLKPGATVYCVLRSVSASGMSRRIDFYTFRKNQERFLSGYIAIALGYSRGKGDGLLVQGCGMDMGFHVVYSLGHALYPKGFVPAKAGKHGRNGSKSTELDTDGGYALNSRWL